MRLYRPVYPTRYTPDTRPPVPACHTHRRRQESLCAMPDRTPDVEPFRDGYAGSVRGFFADSRVSGDCRVSWYDDSEGQGIVRFKIVPAKSPYFRADVTAEGALAIMIETGVHIDGNGPAMFCGVQRTDFDWSTLKYNPDSREILQGYRDAETSQHVPGERGFNGRSIDMGVV